MEKEITFHGYCAEYDADFLKKNFKAYKALGGTTTAYLVSMVKSYRNTFEKHLAEKGIKDGYAYALQIGKNKALSGVGSIVLIEAIKGEKGIITVEYDVPTFASAGFSSNDIMIATMYFMSQSVTT